MCDKIRVNIFGRKAIRSSDVDKIIDRKIVGGNPRYLVKWRRFSELNTWEIRESFLDATILEKYDHDHPLPARQSTGSTTCRTSIPKARSRVVEKGAVNVSTGSNVNRPRGSISTISENNIPSGNASVKTLMENDLQCGICLGLFKKPCVTECEHIFCEECLNMWQSNRSSTCPICRRALSKAPKKLNQINDFLVKLNQIVN